MMENYHSFQLLPLLWYYSAVILWQYQQSINKEYSKT